MDVVFQRWWDAARLKEVSIGSGERSVIAEQFPLMAEGHMKHELLLTVLLILRTFWVRWAVRPHDDNHFFLLFDGSDPDSRGME